MEARERHRKFEPGASLPCVADYRLRELECVRWALPGRSRTHVLHPSGKQAYLYRRQRRPIPLLLGEIRAGCRQHGVFQVAAASLVGSGGRARSARSAIPAPDLLVREHHGRAEGESHHYGARRRLSAKRAGRAFKRLRRHRAEPILRNSRLYRAASGRQSVGRRPRQADVSASELLHFLVPQLHRLHADSIREPAQDGACPQAAGRERAAGAGHRRRGRPDRPLFLPHVQAADRDLAAALQAADGGNPDAEDGKTG